jgi:hypothetical protein
VEARKTSPGVGVALHFSMITLATSFNESCASVVSKNDKARSMAAAITLYRADFGERLVYTPGLASLSVTTDRRMVKTKGSIEINLKASWRKIENSIQRQYESKEETG